MQSTDYINFGASLRALDGQPCSLISGTAGVGSMITLDFGELTSYVLETVHRGPILVERGVWQISLGHAAWRLREGPSVVCSSSTGNGVGSPMELGLSVLKDRKVTNVRLIGATLDLQVSFIGGFEFETFCEEIDQHLAYGNYSFRCAIGSFLVTPGPDLKFEPAKD